MPGQDRMPPVAVPAEPAAGPAAVDRSARDPAVQRQGRMYVRMRPPGDRRARPAPPAIVGTARARCRTRSAASRATRGGADRAAGAAAADRRAASARVGDGDRQGLAHALMIEGAAADAACAAVSAPGFTVWHDVVIGRSPSEGARRATLRHELVHVAQTGMPAPTGPLRIGAENAPAERETERLSSPDHPRAKRSGSPGAREPGSPLDA